MNQNEILQSNLLDIIFENRNKGYGAYTLRKSYNNRMRIALFAMVAVSLLFCFFIYGNSNIVLDLSQPKILPHDREISEYHIKPPKQPEAIVNVAHPKKTTPNDFVPKIVDSININKLPATPPELTQSLNSTSVSEINFSRDNGGSNNKTNGNEETPATSAATKVNKPGPLNVADITPQYPGGIKALLDFLKKNLHAPEDIDQGDEISVKVKFVVDYDGKLESFNVIKSGGTEFDNEVVRVLKKMPLWIPGKSSGENVSVYYVVPVKFTSEF